MSLFPVPFVAAQESIDCSQGFQNRLARELEVLKRQPNSRNNAWNKVAVEHAALYCQLDAVGNELRRLQDQPEVISVRTKSLLAEARRRLKIFTRAFQALVERC